MHSSSPRRCHLTPPQRMFTVHVLRRMLPSSDMSAAPQVTTAAYGLAAVLAWGTSDFLGGWATRRANAFLYTTVVNLGGLAMVVTLASATHAPFPWRRSPRHLLPRTLLRKNGTHRASRRRPWCRNPSDFFHVHRRPARKDSSPR